MPEQPSQFRVVRRKNWGAWVVGFVTAGILLSMGSAVSRSGMIRAEIFFKYLFSLDVLIGAKNALLVGTLSLVLATCGGFFVALARLSGNPILTAVSTGYVYIFRGTPMLIQILFWYNALPMMFPDVRITLPFTDIVLVECMMIDIVTPFRAAVFGISLAETSYMSEIIRGGIRSFDKGQYDAALALGLRPFQAMTRVVVPQVFRAIVPSIGNEYINLMKSTSLAMAIGYAEVLRVVTDIYYSSFEVVELLCVAGFWYLVLGAFATVLQYAAERIYPSRQA